jgi:hypothetical protein
MNLSHKGAVGARKNMDGLTRISGVPYERHVVQCGIPGRHIDAEGIWHWDAVPENELLESGILASLADARRRRHRMREEGTHGIVDRGLDALVRLPGFVYVGVQAKDHVRLGGGKLGTFYEEIANMRDAIGTARARARGEVWHSGRLDRGIPQSAMTRQLGIEYVHFPFPLEPPDPPSTQPLQQPLFPHQVDALEALARWADGPPNDQAGHRGILSSPPRTGKTRITGEHMQRYRTIVLFTPKRAYAEQTFETLRPFAADRAACVVDCDNERDIDQVRRVLLETRGGGFVCSTYKSADVIEAAMKGKWDDDMLVVVDEFHNMVSDTRGDTPLGRILTAARRVLFVSGTPVEFAPGAAVHSGPVLYAYPLRRAIEDKRVCDYRVWVPAMTTADGEPTLPMAVDDGDWKGACAMFVVNGMLRIGARRLVCFLPPGGHIDAFEAALREYADDFHAVPCWIGRVSHDTPAQERSRTLREFMADMGNDATLRIMLCVRILDECVDLPLCDSTCHVFPSMEPTALGSARTVQRVLRAGTVIASCPTKVAHTLVWGDDPSIDAFLGALHAADDGLDVEAFRARIRSISADAYDDVQRPGEGQSSTQDVEAAVADVARRYVVDVREVRFKSLAELCPDVAAQWHPVKNGDLSPEDVSVCSGQKVWWLCPESCACGQHPHDWESTIAHRTKPDGQGGYIEDRGCPHCVGKADVFPCESLAARCPEVAAQWHTEKNGELRSDQVRVGCNDKVWWICLKPCACGQHVHEWQEQINNRTKPDGQGGYIERLGCPHCSGNGPKARVFPCESLAAKCPQVAAQWHPDKNGDRRPDQVRVSSNKKVWWICPKPCACGRHVHEWEATINSRTRPNGRGGYIERQGCPHCSGKGPKARVFPCESLAAKCPEVAAQWHPDKNGDLRPDQVRVGCNDKVWWRCPKRCACGQHVHEWQAPINGRTKPDGQGGYIGKNGCPHCSGKVKVFMCESLAAKCPEVAAQWHPDKNGDRRPDQVRVGCHDKVAWRCQHMHEWKASIRDRTKPDGRGGYLVKNGCPHCVGNARSRSLQS